MCLLISQPCWHADDWKNELPVERAQYWLPLVTKLHIPHQVLLQSLKGRIYYYKDDDGRGWKDLIGTLLAKRALVLLALMHAVNHDEPIHWEMSFKTHKEISP